MGKRGGWFSIVKKAFSCESKENREKNNSGRWLEKQTSKTSDTSSPENVVVVPASIPRVGEVKLTEAENEQNWQAYSAALATAAAAEVAYASSQAAVDGVRFRASSRGLGKSREEIAAIKIQTAFRGHLARRTLRALRGLARLKSLMGGQSVKRQATTTLKCMQTLARVQSEIRARRVRISEENSALQRQIQQTQEKELEQMRESVGTNWDDSMQSKEQIEANLQNRQEATIRRERALAYSYLHQQTWRNSLNSSDRTFMDPNNPRWGWSWLERSVAARPWDIGNAVDKEESNDHTPVKSMRSRSASIRGDAKIHSPTPLKQSRPSSLQSPSTPNSKISGKLRPPNTRGTTGKDEDSKSVISTGSKRYRRHSIAGSLVRNNESNASSPAVASYVTSTDSVKGKSRLPSPLGLEKVGTPKKVPSSFVKKRLSFSGSPAGPRRHSVPPNMDVSPNRDAALNS